jgi:hypothetical protein
MERLDGKAVCLAVWLRKAWEGLEKDQPNRSYPSLSGATRGFMLLVNGGLDIPEL